MNDEQRHPAAFGAQPCGTGPQWAGAVLRLAHVELPHIARRAWHRPTAAAVAAAPI